MALILDATVGGAASNSYTTQAEGDTYHEGRLFATAWTGAVAATKDAALCWATRILDAHFEWAGSKFSLEQALRWPRFGALNRDGELFDSDELPPELKNAVSELARLLIIGDRSIEKGTEGLKRLKVDVIELEFDKFDRTKTISDEVYQMISHLGRLKNLSASGGQVSAAQILRT
jgi:hypothetical protein